DRKRIPKARRQRARHLQSAGEIGKASRRGVMRSASASGQRGLSSSRPPKPWRRRKRNAGRWCKENLSRIRFAQSAHTCVSRYIAASPDPSATQEERVAAIV